MGNDLMRERKDTFEADMARRWTDLERAQSPNGLLVSQMRQMREGTFIGKNAPDPEYAEIVKRFKLDNTAEEKLLDCLSRHPYEKRKEYYAPLDRFLSASGNPSAVAMGLLRKIGEGEPLGEPKGKGKGKGDEGKGGRDGNRDQDRDRRDQDRDRHDRDRDRSRGREDRGRDRGRDDGYRDRGRDDRDQGRDDGYRDNRDDRDRGRGR